VRELVGDRHAREEQVGAFALDHAAQHLPGARQKLHRLLNVGRFVDQAALQRAVVGGLGDRVGRAIDLFLKLRRTGAGARERGHVQPEP
jgi:hypothetical protein